MFRRIYARGAVGIAFLALAAAPPILAISPATASAQTATAAGEDNASPPPVTDTQPTPTTPLPVPVAPTPTTPAPPAPTPTKPKRVTRHRTLKHKSGSHHRASTPSKPVAVQRTTFTTLETADTQTFQGGVQAGEGGTAQHGPDGALLGLGSGLLAFGLAAGVQARRRRTNEG